MPNDFSLSKVFDKDDSIKLLVLHDEGGDEDRYFSHISTLKTYVAQNIESGKNIKDYYFDYYRFSVDKLDWELVTTGIEFTQKVTIGIDFRGARP